MPGTRKLGRPTAHRNAMLRGMVTYLLENGQIETTLTRAKEVRSMTVSQLDALIEWKNTYYPDAFWHVNHIGSGSWDHWPAGNTYADFIDAYVENVLKKLEGNGGKSICMDHYRVFTCIKRLYFIELDEYFWRDRTRDEQCNK